MNRTIIIALLFLFLGKLNAEAQVALMPNLVLTQEFTSEKDIWPTFTKGVVHYEAQVDRKSVV